MSVFDTATGEDDFGHVAVTLRDDPARDDHYECLVGRAVKIGVKFCSRMRKESVMSMGRLPCVGVLLHPQKPRQDAKKSRGGRPVFLLSHLPSKVRNENLLFRVESGGGTPKNSTVKHTGKGNRNKLWALVNRCSEAPSGLRGAVAFPPDEA